MRMQWFLLIAVILPAARLDAQEEKPRGKNEQQIPQIKLDRKSPVSYEKEVEPILVNKCAFCHSGNIKEGKFDLSSYDNLMRGGKRGPAVVPGKSAESFLVKISAKDIRPFMPPRSEEALTSQELAVIRLWIDQGAKAPTGARAVAKVVVKLPPASVHPVLGVAVSPDAKLVAASRGNQIHLYETTTGKHVRTMKDPAVVGADGKPANAAHVSLVETLAFSPDGKTLASGSFQEVKLWDATTGQMKAVIPGFAERVLTLTFSHNGKYLACGGGAPSQEGELKLIDPASGKVVREIKENLHSDTVFSVAFSPDDKLMVSSGADKFVKTFEVETGKFQKAFEGHTHHVLGTGFSADGKMIASAGADRSLPGSTPTTFSTAPPRKTGCEIRSMRLKPKSGRTSGVRPRAFIRRTR